MMTSAYLFGPKTFGNIDSRIKNPTLQIDVFEKLFLRVVLWPLQFATASGQTAQFLLICTIANAKPRVPGSEQLTSYYAVTWFRMRLMQTKQVVHLSYDIPLILDSSTCGCREFESS